MLPELIIGGGMLCAIGLGGYAYREHVRSKEAEDEKRREQAEAVRLDMERRERANQDRIAAEKAKFRNDLVRDFRRFDPLAFSLKSYAAEAGIAFKLAAEVGEDLFANFARKVVADGVITADERSKMMALARALQVTPRRAEEIEREARNAVYDKAVADVLADGVITAEEAEALELMRASLGVSRSDAVAIAERSTIALYLAMLDRIVDSGVADPRAIADLEDFKRALALDDSDTARMIREEAGAIFRRAFVSVIQDAVVTTEEESLLAWLQGEIGLSDETIRPFTDQLNEVKRLADYRNGKLPVVTTRKLLEGGETCHWDTLCHHSYQTPKRQAEAAGELLITSKRVMFISPTKNFSFSPSKIMDIEVCRDAVDIKVEGRQGTGIYYSDQPVDLEAILVGVARKGKYLSTGGFASSLGRHIPGEVKREVWSRDGGRCVECGANQYLEFDHIIPHAKGGANTVNNVQLLCRACNNLKRDRI